MLEFAKSRAGKKFLDLDIPKLTEAMENLASAINESNKIQEKKLLIEQKRLLNEKRTSLKNSEDADKIN